MSKEAGMEETISSNVLINFEQAIASANEFEAAVGKVAARMNDISNVKLNVAKMLSSELAKWNESSAMTNQIDMKSFVGKIEKAIGRTILGRDIEILGVEKGAMEIALSGQQVQKIKADIKRAYSEAIEKSAVKFKIPKIVLKDTDVTQIEQAFEQKLKDSLAQKLDFAFDEVGVKPLTLRIDNRHLKKVLDTFDVKLLDMLSDPALFAIDEKTMPKSQASERIKQAMATIDKSFKDLDEHLMIEVAELKKLPNLSEGLDKFRGNLRQLMAEMIEVNKELSKSPVEDAKVTFQTLRAAISNLQHGIAQSATNFITQIHEEIQRAPISTVEAAEYVAAARRIDVVINEFVKSRINNTVAEMLGSMGVGMEAVDGKNIFVPSLKALQKAISQATRQAVENISKGKLDLDVTAINQAFQEWSTFMETKMGDSIKDSLAQITVGMMTADAKVAEAITARVAQLVQAIEVDKKKVGKITISSEEIKERIIPKIKEMVLDLVKNITITEGAEKISIPESALKDLRAALQKMVTEEVEAVQKAVKKRVAAETKQGKVLLESYATEQMEAFRVELVQEIKAMLTSLLTRLNLVLPSNLGIKIDDDVLKAQILPVLQEQVNMMVRNIEITPVGAGAINIPLENMDAINKALSRSLSTYLNSISEINTTLDASEFASISEKVRAELQRFNASIANYMNTVVGIMSAEMMAATPPPAGAVATRPIDQAKVVSKYNIPEGFDLKQAQFLQGQIESMQKAFDSTAIMALTGRKDEIVNQIKNKMATEKGYSIQAAQQELAALMVQPLTQWIGDVGKAVRWTSQDVSSPKLVDVNNEMVKKFQEKITKFKKYVNNDLEQMEDMTVEKVNKGLGSKDLNKTASEYQEMISKLATSINQKIKAYMIDIINVVSITNSEGKSVPIIEPYINEIRAQLEGGIQDMVSDTSKRASQEVAKVSETPITVSTEQLEVLKAKIVGMFNEVMEALAGANFPVSEFVAVVNGGTNELFNALMIKVRAGLTACVEGIGAINFTELGKDESAQLQAIVTEHFNQFMNEYIMAAKQALSILTVTGDMVKGLEAQIAQAVKKGDVGEAHLDLNLAVNEAIKKVQKATMQSVKETVPEVRPLVIKTETLTKAIEKAVAKVIKSVNINIPPIDIAYEIKGTENIKAQPFKVDLAAIKGAIDLYVIQYIKSIAGMLFTETAPKVLAEGFGKAQINKLVAALKPIDAVVADYTKALVAGAQSADYKKSISFKTSKMIPEVVQELAKEKGMTATEFRRDYKSVEGLEELRAVMRQNMNYILRQFHEAIQDQTVLSLKEYKAALTEVKLEPDVSAVTYMQTKLTGLQQEIVRKVRKMLDEQFKLMVSEIRGIKVAPVGMAYTPPASVQAAVSQTVKTTTKAPVTVVPTIPTSKGTIGGGGTAPRVNPGGDTHSFMGSIINTIRYITAGTLFMIPYTLAYEAWNSAKEFDYQLMKAQQNFLMKDPTMKDVAFTEVQRKVERGWAGYTQEDWTDPLKREALINREASRLKKMTREGMIRPLQDVALTYGLNQEEMGHTWHIASRRLDNPYEAFNLAAATGKLYAYEKEGSPEEIAVGLEAIASQFQLSGDDMNRVSNMLIKTAAMSQVTVKDLLESQKRSGSVFLQNMPGVEKDRTLATSLALSSLFVQATGRTGAESGTFWRTVFMAPWKNPTTMKYLENMSQSRPELFMLNPWTSETPTPGTENNLNPQVVKRQKDGLQMFLDVMTAASKMDDESAKDLLVKVYPRWFQAGVLSVQTAMEDLQRIRQRMAVGGQQDVTVADLISELINQIQNVTEEDIATMLVNAQDTFQYKQQKAKTMWQVASFEVMETMKPEFDQLITNLTAWLRSIRDNAGMVSELIHTIGKVAEFIGIKWLGGKVNQKLLNRGYNKNSSWLYQEAQLLDLKRNMMTGKLADAQAKHLELAAMQNTHEMKKAELATAIAYRDELKSKIADVDARRPELESRRSELSKSYSDYLMVEKRTADLNHQLTRLREANVPGYASIIATKEAQLAKFEQVKTNLNPAYMEYMAINQILSDRDNWAKELTSKEKHISNLTKGEKAEADKVQKFAKSIPNVDKITKDIMEADVEMAALQKRIGLLGLAYQDLGLKGMEGFGMVGKGITSASMATVQYATEIKSLSAAAGMSNKQLDGLILKINELTAAENRGKLSAKQLDYEIRKLAADYARLNMAGNGLVGKQLVNTIMADSMMNNGQGAKMASAGNFIGPALLAYGLGKASAGEKASGVLGSLWGGVKGFFSNLRQSPKAAFSSLGAGILGGGKNMIDSVKNFFTVGGIKGAGQSVLDVGKGLLGKGAGLLGSAGKFLKSNWIWAALAGAWDIGSDVFNAQALNEYEKKQSTASKLEELAGQAANLKSMSWANPMKYISGALFGWDWITHGLSRAMGGTAPSFVETWKAAKAMFNQDEQSIKDYLKQQYNVDELRKQALIQERIDEQQHLKEHADEIRINGVWTKKGNVLTAEDAQTIISDMNTVLEERISSISVQSGIGAAWYLLHGHSENSSIVRQEQMVGLEDTIEERNNKIKELDGYLKAIEQSVGEGYQYAESYKLFKTEQNNERLKMVQEQIELQKMRRQEVSFIEERANVDKSMTQLKWSIKQNQLLAQGYSEDSPAVKAVARASLLAQNKDLGNEISLLRQQLGNTELYPVGSDEYKNLLLKITQLESEQVENLAKIHQLMKNELPTFNLPSGVKPMTYYEAMTQNNTHKAVNIQSGDINIQIVMDKNMPTSSAEAMGAAMGKEVAKQIRQVNSSLATNVKSGLGYSYNGYAGIGG